jgi:hypothetical protein
MSPSEHSISTKKTKIEIVTNCHEILKVLIWNGDICGHAIIQEVRCWFLTMEPWIQSLVTSF